MAETRPKDYPKLKNYQPTRFMLPTSHYEKAKADRAVKFIENLRHTKGKWAGKRFWLLPWQEQIIRDVFGVVKEDGNRQFLTAFVEIGKKNGKELALDTPIPTPEGFTSMEDLQVGDIVFDEMGKHTGSHLKMEVRLLRGKGICGMQNIFMGSGNPCSGQLVRFTRGPCVTGRGFLTGRRHSGNR